MVDIFRHPETVCPQCGKPLDSLAQAGGIVEQGVPQPGDLSLCLGCRSVLELTAIGGYRVLSQEEIVALSEEERMDLEATLAHLDMYASWRRQQEEPPHA